uniref:Uncharacterized protein n=1 Tax=Arundo donax TaxID=35708 RepID=A0A0A8ZDT5_ARUDO
MQYISCMLLKHFPMKNLRQTNERWRRFYIPPALYSFPVRESSSIYVCFHLFDGNFRSMMTFF